ncbi:MAG: hypothetical protein M1819_002239 [Sarea resinae]|nr:MAG: hypothetical protein M1819_002239 [Sarea resinae]
MSSHVVVIDSSARRTVVKTSPGKFLSDVLQEACARLGLDSSQYGLKNNNKPIDLSRTFRLSGLSSGAKLELILASRSPSVVSVALQLPEEEAKGIPNGRLADKFPSTTTLWLVLRKFEVGVAGGLGSSRNFTARGTPRTDSGNLGAGRLYYERPVMQAMGRELSSFTDLQKTLGQLGFNNGSVLFRLRFQASDTPLDEAMVEIEQYFKSIEGGESTNVADARGAHAGTAGNAQSAPETEQNPGGNDTDPTSAASSAAPPATATPPTRNTIEENNTPSGLQDNNNNSNNTPAEPTSTPPLPAPTSIDTATSSPRTISVFLPPTNPTPHAAAQTYNPRDYEPTIDHAKLHQQRLASTARNRRLPSEAELAAAQKERSDKLAGVSTVEIKVRFPDQSQVVASFDARETARGLYAFVRHMLRDDDGDADAAPRFSLTYSSPTGSKTIPRQDDIHVDNDHKTAAAADVRLIRDLGLAGRVLVTFVWDDDETASSSSSSRAPVLKDEFRAQARAITVPDVGGALDVEDAGVGGSDGKGKDKDKDKDKDRARDHTGRGERKVPKWLKLPGKK